MDYTEFTRLWSAIRGEGEVIYKSFNQLINHLINQYTNVLFYYIEDIFTNTKLTVNSPEGEGQIQLTLLIQFYDSIAPLVLILYTR